MKQKLTLTAAAVALFITACATTTNTDKTAQTAQTDCKPIRSNNSFLCDPMSGNKVEGCEPQRTTCDEQRGDRSRIERSMGELGRMGAAPPSQ